MKKAKTLAAACAVAFTLTTTLNHGAHAQTIVFSGTDGSLDINSASDSILQDGLTLTLTANTGTVNATTTGLGINEPGAGDDTDGLDTINAVELLTLSFDKDLTFDSITLAGVGADDGLDVSIAGGVPVSISASGQFVFSAPNTVLAGQLVTLMAIEPNSPTPNNGVNVTQFTVTVVPEPSSLALLLGATGVLILPRRWRRRT